MGDAVSHPMSEADRLVEERDQIYAERALVQAKLDPVLDRLAELGVEDHIHGYGTYASPGWWHAHPFEDENHEHTGTQEEAEAVERAHDNFD
jgi:hypothetical protein